MNSCEKDEEINPQEEGQNLNEGLIELGEKLENPYSVENMQKALDNLKNDKGSVISSSDNNVQITPTHLYLRFKPKNEIELNILTADSTLVLYDYPLDYKIKKQGNFYKDPKVTGDQPTYQYCAIPVDKKLPDSVEYEILDKLFIPDDYSDEKDVKTKSSKSYSDQFVDNLVDEALRISNNLDNLQSKSAKVTSSKWRPAGTIQVYDDVLAKFVGVEGVEVRARRLFTTYRGIANASGHFSCDGRFKREANYSIDWERYDFALQDHYLNGATYNGPKMEGNWDLNLDSGKQQYYATIFRAAHHYYYKEIKGLKRPPTNSFWKTQLKIKAVLKDGYKESSGNHKEERRFLGAQIKIYTYELSAITTYSTVIHELAHASHWDMWRSSGFDDTEKIVKESWANGVAWELTRMVYTDFYGDYIRLRYTGVVEDLIDGFKTRNSYYYWTDQRPFPTLFRTYDDKVKGYTIKQLEDALVGQKTWLNWQNNIINTLNNETSNEVHNTFNFWNIQ